MDVQYAMLAAREPRSALDLLAPPDPVWLAHCTHRLRERWPHVDVLMLEETATELWQREGGLREIPGREAAEAWLRRGWG